MTNPPTVQSNTPVNKLDTLYDEYRKAPSPDRLYDVVKSLSPVIEYNLKSVHGERSPILRNKATIYAADAIKKFNPSQGTNLKTYVNSQLQTLRRDSRAMSQSVKVPERMQLELYAIQNAEMEFADKHGREPDLYELADASGFDPKKIEKLRNASLSQATEGAFDANASAVETTYDREALDYVYMDSGHLDKKILEYKLGYGGKKPLASNVEIAQKLKVDPSQISRRLFRMSKRIQEITDDLHSVNSVGVGGGDEEDFDV